MLTLPVAEITRLRLKPGEVVLLTPSRPLAEESADRLRVAVERALARAGHPDAVVAVLEIGMKAGAAPMDQPKPRRKRAPVAALDDDAPVLDGEDCADFPSE